MSKISIHGSEYPVAKVFSDDFFFEVPLYQRPYAWTTEHAGELLDDLLTSINDGKDQVEDLNPYFLGSIVLIKGDQPESQIIDGQQRLITLTILLSSLRSLIPPQSEALTDFIYEKGNPIKGTRNRYRITLRERDAEFFQKYVQDEDGIEKLIDINPATLSDSRRNIFENTRLFKEHLEALSENDRFRLAQYIINGCYLVVVSTPDLDSAYRIFSVLNDRGLDLSHTDILKAEIIGKIPENEQDSYAKKWEDIEEELGRELFQELFVHIRTIYRKAKLQDTILKEFRQYVQPAKNPMEFIDNVLVPYADAFNIIKTGSYPSDFEDDEINTLLKWLNWIDNYDWVPPAISYFSRHGNKSHTLQKFLTNLERLAAGLMILRANINKRNERYSRLLTAIEDGTDLFSPNSPLQLTDNEIREIIKILRSDVYSIQKIRRYILLRLDSALSGGEASYKYSDVTVEHVLPQNPAPDSIWVTWFPDKEEREKYVNCIGNLVLLSNKKNSQAQNRDFDWKKKKYFAARKGVSPFVLTSQVLQEDNWTSEVIERRQKESIETLKNVWNL